MSVGFIPIDLHACSKNRIYVPIIASPDHMPITIFVTSQYNSYGLYERGLVVLSAFTCVPATVSYL